MHTDARSAKKDVISTQTSEGHGRRENIRPRGQRKSTTDPPCVVTPAKCRRPRGTLSCADRASGGEAHSHLSCVRMVTVPSLGGKGEAKNI